MRQKGFRYFWGFSYGWWRKYGWFVCSQQIMKVNNTLWSRTLVAHRPWPLVAWLIHFGENGEEQWKYIVVRLHPLTLSPPAEREVLELSSLLDRDSGWLKSEQMKIFYVAEKENGSSEWSEAGHVGYRDTAPDNKLVDSLPGWTGRVWEWEKEVLAKTRG